MVRKRDQAYPNYREWVHALTANPKPTSRPPHGIMTAQLLLMGWQMRPADVYGLIEREPPNRVVWVNPHTGVMHHRIETAWTWMQGGISTEVKR